MNYRSVENRCAIVFEHLHLPISQSEAIKILNSKGFKIRDVDLINLANKCISSSVYKRGAKLSEAPMIVDCSSLIKWLYGQLGVWLPRRSIQQRELGESMSIEDISPGDVIFVSGWIDYFLDDPSDGVGHVGIYSSNGNVIHAANKELGVCEISLDTFVEKGFRGIRRYIPKNCDLIVLDTPPERQVETSDDIKWIVLQSI